MTGAHIKGMARIREYTIGGHEDKMKLFKENKIISIILLVCILGSFVVLGQRAAVEKDSRTADIVLDYEETTLLADQSEQDTLWWLKEFADMGIMKVGLYEETLDSLTKSDKKVKAELVCDLRKDTYWMSNAPAEVLAMIDENVKDDFDVMVIAESKDIYAFIKRAFEERFDPARVKSLDTEQGGYLLIDGTVKDSLYYDTEKLFMTEDTGFKESKQMVSSVIMYLNLGLLPEKVAEIQAAGCRVEPVPVGYTGWNDTRFLKDVTTQYENLGVVPSYWIMGSRAVPGYDDGTEALTEYINENDIVIGIVENTTQRQNISPEGMEAVIEGTDYDVVRAFSVWPYIQYRYGYYGYDSYEEIENSLFRAVVERNIKLIYYKPMKETDDSYTYITDVQDYRDSFASLEKRLAEHGITLGEAQPSAPYQVPLALKLLAAIGAGCGALLCLRAIFQVKQKWIYLLFGIGCVGVAGAYFVMPNTAPLLSSFGASLMLPCVAAIWMVYEPVRYKEKMHQEEKVGKLLLRGIGVLLGGVAISLMGAAMTAAPISGIDYMLELDIFRGVKLAQLAPLAFFMLLFFLFALYLWGEKEKQTLELRDVKWILNYDIKVWMVLLGLLVGAAGIIYLARTGHESSIGASSLELLARNYLEEMLYARPRTKEFLIAFPAVILFVYSIVRELKIFSFLFGVAGVIGFTSVVNTFMHIRTPLELGFARTGYAVLFGIVLGIVYTLILEVFYRLYRKRGRRKDA